MQYLQGGDIMKKGKNEEKPDRVDVPTGASVHVRPHPKVGLRFKHVSKKGKASAKPTTTFPPHPQGKFLSEVFDITTDAVFSETVMVEISFDGTGLTEEQKKKLRVYRHDLKPKAAWEDVTSSIDTKKDIAYGETDHFSIFGVR
jgi:hypothetical protein